MKHTLTTIAVLAVLTACDRGKAATDPTTAPAPPTPVADATAATPIETVFVAQVPPPAPRRAPAPAPQPGLQPLTPPRGPPPPGPDAARRPRFLDAGTEITTTLDDGIHSEYNGPGEPIHATVASDVMDGDRVAIPAGSVVTFRINAIGPASARGERATLDMSAENVRINGRDYPIRGSATDYDFELKPRSVNGGDVATAAGGAAIGALIGHVLGGKTGTIIGAVGGGALGTAQAAKNVDRDIIVRPGTRLTLVLGEPFERS